MTVPCVSSLTTYHAASEERNTNAVSRLVLLGTATHRASVLLRYPIEVRASLVSA